MASISSEILTGLENATKRVSEWYEKTSFTDFHQTIEKRIIGQKDLPLITTAVWAHLKAVATKSTIPGTNVILSAPSGCGKTETFRALRDYFVEELPDLPVTQVDMNLITSEGFKGADTISIVAPLMNAPTPFGGVGIVFLDEFDKRIMPSYSSTGENVNQNIQNQILTLIEGREVESTSSTRNSINSSYTLFIACGSFDEVRKNRDRKRASAKPLGFGASAPSPSDIPEYASPITKRDIIDHGALHELVGRFAIVASYSPIGDTYYDAIIDKTALTVANQFGLSKIEIGAEYRNYLKKLSKSKEGVRALASNIKQDIFPLMSKIYSRGYDKTKYITIKLEAPGKYSFKTRSTKNPVIIHTASKENEKSFYSVA